MPSCLLALVALLTPRLVLVLLVAFTGFLGEAYQTVLWPLVGFFVVPLTTLAYAVAINWNHTVTGGYFVLVLLASLADLGALGGTGYRQRTFLFMQRRGM